MEDLDRTLLSVVVPIFDEREALPELERRLAEAVEPLGFVGQEFILVSDGSRDGSEGLIRGMVARDPRYRGVFLSRNFGHQAAISTGLAHARGSVVAVIDGDLQDPPEAIAALVWFSLVSLLMIRTGKFWNCVIAHAVTNGLLGIYIQAFHRWELW